MGHVSTAIYLRISSDPTGLGLGVERQEADNRALADRLGWTVYRVYSDNDISAYSGKKRPEYEEMLADIAAGKVQAVIAWHTDRLHRSPRELERFIDLAEETGLRVETVKAGTVDLSTPSGRAVARTLGAWGRFESEHKSTRIRAKLAANAAAGKPHGGHRPYGWEPDRRTIREPEAEVIREAVERVLSREPIRALLRDFNARGLYNAHGKPWTHTTLRGVLLNARHAGLYRHHGEIVGAGDWPAIVEPESWRAMKRILEDPKRRTTPGRAGRLHLLSGLATCAICGEGLHVGTAKGVDVYRCWTPHVSRSRVKMEALIGELVVARLSRGDARDLLLPDDDDGARKRAAAEAENVRRRLDEAAAMFAEGALTAEQLRTITGQLRPQLAELEERATPSLDRVRMLGDLVGAEDVGEAWERMRRDAPDRARAVVGLLMEIRIGRGRKGPGFKPDGIEVTPLR